MARFDVYAHPDTALRKATPFLLDVQNSYIDSVETRVVVPLRRLGIINRPITELQPSFIVRGQQVVMDTPALAAFPASGLRTPVDQFQRHSTDVVAALDTLFGSF